MEEAFCAKVSFSQDSDLKVTGGPAHPGPKISVWLGLENNFSWPCGPSNN